MAVEPRCPDCVPGASKLRTQGPNRKPPAAGSLTFTCECGSAATVSTISGPGRELARLGWTFRFIAN